MLSCPDHSSDSYWILTVVVKAVKQACSEA